VDNLEERHSVFAMDVRKLVWAFSFVSYLSVHSPAAEISKKSTSCRC